MNLKCALFAIMALQLAPAFYFSPLSRAESPSIDLSSGLLYDRNLSNAERASDVESETFWNVNAGAAWSGAVAGDWRSAARIFTGAEVPFEYEAFTMGRVGADVRLFRKFGLGPTAPRGSIGCSIEREIFDEHDMSNWLVMPSLRWTHGLSESWSVDFLYRVDARYAERDLYSGHGHEGGLMLRGNVGERWSFSSGYGLRYGDIVSYATPPRPDIKSLSSIIVPENTAFERPLTAYRLDAISHSFAAGSAYALTPDISLELGGEFQYISRSEISYDDIIIQLSVKSLF